ncbi:MAG TPA: class II aldolase/adducin family protein, partial [Beijerinckiaceae bacterium]|nr:class II aldolase/adducin family protein [Beijerinckiaceae bacterium]
MTAIPVSITRAAGAGKPVIEDERRVRVDLAALYRLIALNRLDDLFATHISARVPGAHNEFLINPYRLLFAQVTASNLVKVDLDGNIIQDTPHTINPAGFVIHSAIHAARPDANFIIHTHTVAGMAIAALEEGLLPISQKSLRFYNRIGYHDYEGKADNLDERSRLVQALGKHNA